MLTNWSRAAVCAVPGVSPITNITFVATEASGPPDIGGGYISIPQDLNEGAGGKFIWAYYRR